MRPCTAASLLLSACMDNNSSGGGGDLACAACGVLRYLTGVDEIRKYRVSDADGVPILASLPRRHHHLRHRPNLGHRVPRPRPLPNPALLLLVPRGCTPRHQRALPLLHIPAPLATARLLASGVLPHAPLPRRWSPHCSAPATRTWSRPATGEGARRRLRPQGRRGCGVGPSR
jgi:hypothetical protein